MFCASSKTPCAGWVRKSSVAAGPGAGQKPGLRNTIHRREQRNRSARFSARSSLGIFFGGQFHSFTASFRPVPSVSRLRFWVVKSPFAPNPREHDLSASPSRLYRCSLVRIQSGLTPVTSNSTSPPGSLSRTRCPGSALSSALAMGESQLTQPRSRSVSSTPTIR